MSRQRRHQLAAIEKGLCVSCFKPNPNTEHQRCPICLERVRAMSKQRRLKVKGGSVRAYRCSICRSYEHRKEHCPQKEA